MKITGADALLRQLKKNANMDDIKRTVKLNGSELQRRMQRNASFTQGYQTGTTKRSINLTIEGNGFVATVGPSTDYSPYLELGTRFMSAQPFVKPSFTTQEKVFIKDMRRLTR